MVVSILILLNLLNIKKQHNNPYRQSKYSFKANKALRFVRFMRI